MLYHFIQTYREAIIGRTRERVIHRPWPPPSSAELEHGVPLFLTQLAESLKGEADATPFSHAAIAESAARHGRELLALGFNVSQVVHDYGDICQSVTEIAVEHGAPITTQEFHTLNRCLDTAIAEAVTEHARLTAESRSLREVERQGQVAHEMRNLLGSALLAFESLKRGTVAINGSTAAVLGWSLTGLHDMVESTLSETRLSANYQRRERIGIRAFVADIAEAANLHAELRGQHLVVEPITADVAVDGDPQLLASAVTNLLNNAFKYTPPGGQVILRSRADGRRVLIEVQDECGGIPETAGDPFKAFGERRGSDRTGLGLGLSIARKAVSAHDGGIHVRNTHGKYCVFIIDLPAVQGVPA